MTVSSDKELKKCIVVIRRFDPAEGPQYEEEFALPVDSPDEENAIASTIANAASWPGKVEGGHPLPIAFMAISVTLR